MSWWSRKTHDVRTESYISASEALLRDEAAGRAAIEVELERRKGSLRQARDAADEEQRQFRELVDQSQAGEHNRSQPVEPDSARKGCGRTRTDAAAAT